MRSPVPRWAVWAYRLLGIPALLFYGSLTVYALVIGAIGPAILNGLLVAVIVRGFWVCR